MDPYPQLTRFDAQLGREPGYRPERRSTAMDPYPRLTQIETQVRRSVEAAELRAARAEARGRHVRRRGLVRRLRIAVGGRA